MSLYHVINSIKYLFVVPHIITFCFLSENTKRDICEDVQMMNMKRKLHHNLAYYLVFCKAYRNVFYYRVGRVSRLLRMLLPKYGSFYISKSLASLGGGAYVLSHPYSTIINAKSIGRNFSISQLTTIGNKCPGRNDLIPTIGDNVTLGANVNIVGNVRIGNNVVVGAGSVVVKDVPDNCIVAGNPAKIIRYLS